MRGLLIALCLLLPVATASAQSPEPTTTLEPVRAHRVVSTDVPGAQVAFDDGLTLLYAFNPEEARVSFERALHADPSLAMAWWGVAMSRGVNLNVAYDAGSQSLGHDAIVKAQTLESKASPVERSLIEAAAARFKFFGPKDADRSAQAYRDAMKAAAAAYPQDDDVDSLAAEAEMDAHAWDFFHHDGTPVGDTDDIIARLQTVLARSPHHIGANHFMIHALEESPHPERALPSADELASDSFEPAAEHLMHMPAHAYMRAGHYHEAGVANVRAIEAYRTYLAGDPPGHSDYFGHDCVFGVAAFLMSDESARAHALAILCARHGASMGSIIDLRFRQWDALAKDDNVGSFALGMLALHRGDVPGAKTQLTAVRAGTDAVSTIETGLLRAGIARTAGSSDDEIAALKRAVSIQDAQWYSEPPRFFYPVRESLGGAFLRAGQLADAEQTFRADLDVNPDNPRSLYGLEQTLQRENRQSDAAAIETRFAAASRRADVPYDTADL